MKPIFDPKKRFICIAVILSAIIVSISGLFTYWLFLDTTPPIDGIQGHFSHMEKTPDGQIAVGHWEGTRRRSCPGVTQHWLKDGVIVALPPHPLPYAPEEEYGQTVIWEFRVLIPSHLKHPVRYQIQQEYYCNPLQRLMYPLVINPPLVPLWENGKPESPIPTGGSLNRTTTSGAE